MSKRSPTEQVFSAIAPWRADMLPSTSLGCVHKGVECMVDKGFVTYDALEEAERRVKREFPLARVELTDHGNEWLLRVSFFVPAHLVDTESRTSL